MSRARHLLAACGGLGLVLLILPFAGLVHSTEWTHFRLVPGDFDAVRVSLIYTAAALAIIIGFGTPVAYWLARHRFHGKWLAELLILLPLLTPPLAMGILLSTLYGPYGWAGAPFAKIGVELSNSAYAFVLAQVYSAAPYYIVAARAAFEAVPGELEQVALTLGKTRWQCFVSVTLPLARLGLAAGAALAWVRALGEFGVVLIIAYFPQGIPVKLWVNLQDYGLSAVYPLLWLFFLIAMPVPLLLGILSRRQSALGT
ncbi:sulfate ABC transporter permease [Acidihalobacter yilgarnensis]|uniref:Sulfate ABC transporter permease n=1 Tax=Acidihalobacter yilgarnensis TaxID=2819280 RepID=A0A1D8ILC7_9GAMM|nr:ABC transporter permease subunit [Acidihalobacter yilgarnensis]AOU97243.1 sulfate ABC transporter permease [Acidihalobacter yilgarnensis]